MNILRGAFAPGRNGGGGGGKGGGGAGGDEKPHAQAKLLSPTEKCKICNEPAAKHIHYGAMTCFSCRAFFRRSIQNKTANSYTCRRSQNCEINLRTRKNCQFCRYQKCLQVGMKTNWVLSEEERQRRFRKVRERHEANDLSQNHVPEDDYHDDGEEEVEENGGQLPESNSYHEQNGRGQNSYEEVRSILQNSFDQRGERLEDPQEGSSLGYSAVSLHPVQVKVEPRNPSPSYYDVSQIQVKDEPGSRPFTTHITSSSENSSALINAICSGRVDHTICSSSISPAVTQVAVSGHSNRFILPTNSQPSVIVQQNQNLCTNDGFSMMMGDDQPKMEMSNGFQDLDSEDPDFEMISNFVDNVHPTFISVSEAGANPSLYSGSNGSILPRHNSQAEAQPIVAGDYVETVLEGLAPDEMNTDEEEGYVHMNGFYDPQPEIVFTPDEAEILKNVVDSHNERYRSVNFGEELIKEMIFCSMFSIPVSTQAAITGYRLIVERITRIANHQEAFKQLSNEDQGALLKENANLLVSLRGAIFFDSQKNGAQQVMLSMGEDDIQTIENMFSKLLREDTMKHIDYKTFNSIQAIGLTPKEDRYNYLQEKVGKVLNDETISILLTYTVLFSPDFCSLTNSREVYRTQSMYLMMLYRYIYAKYPRPAARLKLANVLDVITCIREMAEIKELRAINQNLRVNL